MEVESDRNDNSINDEKQTKSDKDVTENSLITKEEEIPQTLGGIIKLNNTEMPVFCVDDFSITNENGEYVSLSNIAKSREKFESDLIINGTIVAPFPQQVRPNSNPLFCVKGAGPKTRAPKTTSSTKSSTKGKSTKQENSINININPQECYLQAKEALNVVQLPFIAGNFTVLCLGTINPASKYYTQTLLFPIGYRCKRSYWSIYTIKISDKCEYINEILDGGEKGPIFRVYPESNPLDAVDAASTSGAWKIILQKIKDLREANGESSANTALSGPEMFGLTNSVIAKVLEGLDNVDKCINYVFTAMRQRKTSTSSSIPQGDAQSDSGTDFDSSELFSDSLPLEPESESDNDDNDDNDSSDMDEVEDLEDMEDMDNMEDMDDMDDMDDLDDMDDVDNVDNVDNADNDRDDKSALSVKSESKPIIRIKTRSQSTSNRKEKPKMKLTEIKRPYIGKDTYLIVRCRICKGGLEAEDSLINNTFTIEEPITDSDSKVKAKSKSKTKPKAKDNIETKTKTKTKTKTNTNTNTKTNTKSKKSKTVIDDESEGENESGIKIKLKLKTKTKSKTKSISKKKAAELAETIPDIPKKTQVRRGRHVEMLSDEVLNSLNFEGTYTTGFEIIDNDYSHVRVRPSSSSLFIHDGYKSVLKRMKEIIDYDLQYSELGHLLQLLYSLRLIKPTPLIQEVTGIKALLSSLAVNDDTRISDEAKAILLKWNQKRGKRQKVMIADNEDNANESTYNTRKHKVVKKNDIKMLPDDVTYEPCTCTEPTKVSISIKVKHWGIKYHETDCFLYALGINAIFILDSNTVKVQPRPDYSLYFLREKRLFEICWQLYDIIHNLAEKGKYLLYDTIMSEIWNNNHSDEILLIEEDLITEYPFIYHEMRALDKMKEFPANVNIFGMNEFISTLEYKYEIWKKNSQSSDYIYIINNQMKLARCRQDMINADETLQDMIASNKLPACSCTDYPSFISFDEISCDELKKLFEVWTFVNEYQSTLNIPANVSFPFNRISFMDETPSDFTEISEQEKKNISIRKQMRDVNWFKSGLYNCNHFISLCDSTNFANFIIGFYNKHSYDVNVTNDVYNRIVYILLQLMRHPDCYMFLYPVDEERYDVPGYYDIVKNPMAFETICKRIISGWYEEERSEDDLIQSTHGEGIKGIVSDIYLIYSNCRLYNGSDSSPYRLCQKMMSITDDLLLQWIVPICPEVEEVMPTRTIEKQDSDEETVPSKSRRKTKKQRAPIQHHITSPEVKDIVSYLSDHDFASLSSSSQISLLYSLYQNILETETIQDEINKRLDLVEKLQQEHYSLQSQLYEISELYSKQELRLRDIFIHAVEASSYSYKQQKEMCSVKYKPNEKSKNTAEKDLASFLLKKSTMIGDLKTRLNDHQKQLIDAQKSCWQSTLLGMDHKFNEYYYFPNDNPSRIWVINEETQKCGYFWHPSQLDLLMAWLDNRGANEHLLYSTFKLILPSIKERMDINFQLYYQTNKKSLEDLSMRKRKDLDNSEFVLYETDKTLDLYQVHGQWIGVKQLEEGNEHSWKCQRNENKVSKSIKIIVDILFQPVFMNNKDNTKFVELQQRVKSLASTSISLEDYKQLVLDLEDCISTYILEAYIHPDWILSRTIWKTMLNKSKTFSDVSYYLRDLEASCVNFTIVNALTQAVDESTFTGLLEKQMKSLPRLPEVGETVVYSAKGHQVANQDFFKNNVFGGIYHHVEKEQKHDYLCKVQKIDYFWGNGNPFIRLTLAPFSPYVLYSLVQSYYDCCDKNDLCISVHQFDDDEVYEPFTVVIWLSSTNSDFVIPFDKYCFSFVNNFHKNDHYKMWFEGIESQTTISRRKRKEQKAEGSYLTGNIDDIQSTDGAFFPWECLSVTWDSNGSEAGTTHINPWECEYQQKERERTRENTRSVIRLGESKRLTEEDMKQVREAAANIARTHTAEEGDQFYRFISRYWNEKGQDVIRPVLSYETLDLGLFWKLMQAFGGYEMVVNSKGSWQGIYKLLPNYREQNTSAPTSLHKIYLKYLWQFEKEQREEKGLSPICQPRLPIPTNPGKSVGKNKIEEKEEKESDDILLFDLPTNIQFLAKVVKEQEKLKSMLTNKVKVMTNSLQYKEGTISTVNEEVEDFAYRGIVHGNVCMLKRQIEAITKFISQMKQILHFYL